MSERGRERKREDALLSRNRFENRDDVCGHVIKQAERVLVPSSHSRTVIVAAAAIDAHQESSPVTTYLQTV